MPKSNHLYGTRYIELPPIITEDELQDSEIFNLSM